MQTTPDRLDAAIHERNGPALCAGKLGVEIDAEPFDRRSRRLAPGVVGRSVGAAPMSSDAPTTWPPLTPPPAISMVQHCGQ